MKLASGIGRARPAVVFVAAFIFSSLSPGQAQAPDDPALWVAHSRGSTRLPLDGVGPAFHIATSGGTRAVAIDRARGQVWTLAQAQLVVTDLTGAALFSVPVPEPRGEPVALFADAGHGGVWLAMQSQVRAYDAAGRLFVSRDLGKAFSAATFDGQRARLWFAVGDTLTAVDPSGAAVASYRLAGVKLIRSLAYAADADRIWLLADDTLRRFDANGGAMEIVAQGAGFRDLARIEADGRGGLWAIDKRGLFGLSGAGMVTRQLRPLMGETPELAIDLAADAADGSVWVASQHGVVHVDAAGNVVARPGIDAGDGKTRVIADLHLATGPALPRIQIVSPAAGAILGTNRPGFSLSYSGSDLNLASISFTADGIGVSSACQAGPATAQCTLNSILLDGQHTIRVAIANGDGAVSEPATVVIRVDTVAPALTITSPTNGLLTNNRTLPIAGGLGEAAALTLNGAALPTTGNQFSTTATLVEGSNTFAFVATDLAGNRTMATRMVVLDTTPPPAPAQDLVEATVNAGQVTVAGRAGSVEPGSLVTVLNVRTGQRVTVTAGPDGSFSAVIAGSSGDELRVSTTDAATNQGGTTTVMVTGGGPFAGPIQLGTSAPANGATVTGDFVLVSVDLQAPPNTGVTINGVVATPAVAGPALRFHAVIPLATGPNSVVINARGQDGRVASRTIGITSTGPFPYRVNRDRNAGMSPLPVGFEVVDQLGRGILQVQADFNNDGVIDHVSDGTAPITATFTGTGLRQSRFIVFDSSGQGHSQLVSTVLLTPSVVDASIQAIWSGLNTSLTAGDHAGALQFLSPGARDQYGPVFSALLPQMTQIVASYSALQQSLVSRSYVEYGVNRVIDGVDRIFLVGFMLNDAGQWQVESM